MFVTFPTTNLNVFLTEIAVLAGEKLHATAGVFLHIWLVLIKLNLEQQGKQFSFY